MEKPEYTETEQRIHALTNHLISRDGAYSPIDLLLEDRRLTHADYQAWRSGEAPWLSELLACSALRANALLNIAANWARAQGFTPRALDYTCWRGPLMGRALDFCAPKSALDASLLGTGFHAPPESAHHQGDLFVDSPVTVTLNQLRRALVVRDQPVARAAWERLRVHNPQHPFLSSARELLDNPQPENLLSGNPARDCRRLEALQADAGEWLGPVAARECLAPHWLALAAGLDAARYDQAGIHPAFVYARLDDYDACCDAVRACSEHRRHPPLMTLLIEAEFKRGNRLAALNALCPLLWAHPRVGMEQWERSARRDLSVRVALENLDASPALGARDLPALLLLAERGLAHHLTAGSDAPQGFTALRALCVHPGMGKRQLQLRKALQDRQPALLRNYLSTQNP